MRPWLLLLHYRPLPVRLQDRTSYISAYRRMLRWARQVQASAVVQLPKLLQAGPYYLLPVLHCPCGQSVDQFFSIGLRTHNQLGFREVRPYPKA